MALALQVEKIEDIAEPLREHYKASPDGKSFVLDVPQPEDTSKQLKSALTIERKARLEAENRVKAWADVGKSPEEIQALLEQETAREEERAKKAGEWDKMRDNLVASHKKEIDKLRADHLGETGKLTSKLEDKTIIAEATSAIVAANGEPELLLPVVRKFVTLDEHYNVVVKGDDGVVRLDNAGKPMTIAALIDEMKQGNKYARAFLNVDSGGGASNKGNGNPPAPPGNKTNVKRKSDLKTREERSAFLREHGEAAYVALPY